MSQKLEAHRAAYAAYKARADFYHQKLLVEPKNTHLQNRYLLNEKVFFLKIERRKNPEGGL